MSNEYSVMERRQCAGILIFQVDENIWKSARQTRKQFGGRSKVGANKTLVSLSNALIFVLHFPRLTFLSPSFSSCAFTLTREHNNTSPFPFPSYMTRSLFALLRVYPYIHIRCRIFDAAWEHEEKKDLSQESPIK